MQDNELVKRCRAAMRELDKAREDEQRWEPANQVPDPTVGDYLAAIIPIVQEAQREPDARKLYEQKTANDPAIHCNRFPSWDELSEAERAKRVAAIRKEPTDG